MNFYFTAAQLNWLMAPALYIWLPGSRNIGFDAKLFLIVYIDLRHKRASIISDNHKKHILFNFTRDYNLTVVLSLISSVKTVS